VTALEVACHSREQNFIIFSDSKSSPEAINNFQIEVDLVQKFIKDYTLLSNSGKNILCVGSQVIRVSEVMKKQTSKQKAALSLSVTLMKLPASEFFSTC